MPVVRLAIHLEIISEMNEPPKPNTAANTSRLPLLPSVMPNTPQDAQHDAQQHQDGQVGGEEQERCA